MSNMILLAKGSGGDVNPFIQLGCLLKSRGHCVTLVTHGYFAQAVKAAGLDCVPLDRYEEYIEAEKFERSAQVPVDGLLSLVGRYVIDKLPMEYELLRSLIGSEETVLFTHMITYDLAKIAAEKLRIPLISVLTMPYFVNVFQSQVKMVQTFAKPIGDFRAKLGLPPISDWEAWLKSADEFLALWPDWFTVSTTNWPLPLKTGGFLFDQNKGPSIIPQAAQEFLEKYPQPVLLTHATTIPKDSGYFNAAVAACRSLQLPTILVTRHREFIPTYLPEEIKWFEVLPFDILLERIGIVIHHGGIGTIAQALKSGVPQLILPKGYDRPYNAIQVKKLGVGDFLLAPQWKPELIADRLQQLLGTPGLPEQCRKYSQLIKSQSPDVIVDIIEKVS